MFPVTSYLTTLSCATSAIAIIVSTGISSAAAQEQAAQTTVGLEEITVTARRVEENIQRVPIAVSAFTEEMLQYGNITNVNTLLANLPGISSTGGEHQTTGTSIIFARGVERGTPTYFADVPISTLSSKPFFFDVASVQVLKGPQGTLFGEASIAGAFIYEPAKPSETFGGKISATVGTYRRRTLEGVLNLPLMDDKLLTRLAVESTYRRGYITNIKNNKRLNGFDYVTIRPSVIFRPTEDIENYTVFQYFHTNRNETSFFLADFNMDPRGVSAVLTTQATANGMTRAQWIALRDQVLAEQIQIGPYKVNGFSAGCSTPLGPLRFPEGDCVAEGWTKQWFLSNTTTWDVTDNISLKHIFGAARGTFFSQPTDTDGSRVKVFDGGNPRNTETLKSNPVWSDEIQVQISDLFGVVDLTAGVYNTHQYNKPIPQYGLALGVVDTLSVAKTSTRTRAVYGQGNIDLSEYVLDGLTLTVGSRYTWDSARRQTWNMNPTTRRVTTVVGGPTSPAGSGAWSYGSYTLGAQWQMNPDVMLFVTNAKSYSSGLLQNVPGLERVDPDSLNNIEAGTKATFNVGNMIVRTNASYFYGWFNNIKVSVFDFIQRDPPPAPKTGALVTKNAAKAKLSGIDADLTVVPVDWLELAGFVGYLDVRYTKWDSFDPVQNRAIDLSSSKFTFTPDWKFGLRGTVHLPIPEDKGALSVSGNFSWTGKIYYAARPLIPTNPANPATGIICTRQRTVANGYNLSADGKTVDVDCLRSWSNLDVTIDWRDVWGAEGISAALQITNVTNNKTSNAGCWCEVALGNTGRMVAPPRMYSLKLGYSF